MRVGKLPEGNKGALLSPRVRVIASAAVVFLYLFGWVLQTIPQEKNRLADFCLIVQREIPLEHPLSFPADGGWQMRRVAALHPDGKRALALVPGERKLALRPRPASGLTERSFVLAWVDLSTGQLSQTRELSFSEKEGFGFSMASGGDSVCVIAGQKVMILDERLSTIDWKGSEITDPQGEKRLASSCNFVEGTSTILVGFTLAKGVDWDWRSSLMQWNWKEKTVSLFHWDAYLPDSLPVRENQVVTARALPDWLYRFRLEEMHLRTQHVSWAREHEAYSTSRLVGSKSFILSVSALANLMFGSIDYGTRALVPERFRDRYKRAKVKIPYQANLRIEGPRFEVVPTGHTYLGTDDCVVVWERGSTQRESKFRVRGVVLHWPLAIAQDETWFAARAVKFSHFADNLTLHWEFNQFVIFSLDGSKRRLYLSEKFGPDEAITGLAVSGDDKTLLVTTSRKLLVYEVKEVEARK